MQTHPPVPKAGGRLSREDQRRLGDILQRVYDDVIRQGVPDRFRNLLEEIEESRGERADENKIAGPAQADGGRDPEPDRLVEAKTFPSDKGSSS